ncbi:MAG: metallophosphoesterase [Oscillospiraceae bacterium]|nr:metallophosphoesterase [Oscillospiraceae bacterium]
MLYAIGDLHLSVNLPKKMDVFGGAWENYEQKISRSLSELLPEDTLLLCGDTSWGMNLSQSLPDFLFLKECPAKKLLLKGNHDYFWDTEAKMSRFWSENSLHNFSILHNNAFLHQSAAICGTRGWFYEEEKGSGQDEKMINREVIRLRASLDAGRRLTDGELIVFLHYPPLYNGYRCRPILDVLHEYQVRRCYYGHLHGHSRMRATEGEHQGIVYRLISADHLNFRPLAVNLGLIGGDLQ